MPVIPFLSLSSGGRARRRKGQKGHLGELRVAEGTKRRSGAPPGGSGGQMKTEAPEEELEDEAAALPPASSSSAASPLQPPEEIKPPQEELAGPERRPRRSSPRARVMTASGAHLEHEAPERQRAVEVGPYSDFTAFDARPLSSSAAPLTPAAQGDDPGEFTEPATRMTGSPVPHGAATDA